MNAETIERWISSIGRTYDALVAEGVIPNQPLTELYQGRSVAQHQARERSGNCIGGQQLR
jgi:hypothetical protein